MLELGEDGDRAGYLGDAAGTDGDVLEDCPALGEQGKSALSLAAQVAQQRDPGAHTGVKFLVPRGFLTGPPFGVLSYHLVVHHVVPAALVPVVNAPWAPPRCAAVAALKLHCSHGVTGTPDRP